MFYAMESIGTAGNAIAEIAFLLVTVLLYDVLIDHLVLELFLLKAVSSLAARSGFVLLTCPSSMFMSCYDSSSCVIFILPAVI